MTREKRYIHHLQRSNGLLKARQWSVEALNEDTLSRGASDPANPTRPDSNPPSPSSFVVQERAEKYRPATCEMLLRSVTEFEFINGFVENSRDVYGDITSTRTFKQSWLMREKSKWHQHMLQEISDEEHLADVSTGIAQELDRVSAETIAETIRNSISCFRSS